ncbi:hypothetical protein CROQUDRAFT_43895, partial [Cronartium quercuum f. sp. fusiforme G11]
PILGPNHIWWVGQSKCLEIFGLTLYAITVTWSRCILGLFVHLSDLNSRQIGLLYLQTIKKRKEKIGGIPI